MGYGTQEDNDGPSDEYNEIQDVGGNEGINGGGREFPQQNRSSNDDGRGRVTPQQSRRSNETSGTNHVNSPMPSSNGKNNDNDGGAYNIQQNKSNDFSREGNPSGSPSTNQQNRRSNDNSGIVVNSITGAPSNAPTQNSTSGGFNNSAGGAALNTPEKRKSLESSRPNYTASAAAPGSAYPQNPTSSANVGQSSGNNQSKTAYQGPQENSPRVEKNEFHSRNSFPLQRGSSGSHPFIANSSYCPPPPTWRLCHPVNIYVYRNGMENEKPCLVHIPMEKKKNMNTVLEAIGTRMKLPVGYPVALYHMDGLRVCKTYELTMYNSYVVVTNLEKRFKCVDYGRVREPLVVIGSRCSKHINTLKWENRKFDLFCRKKMGRKPLHELMADTGEQDGLGPSEIAVAGRPCGVLCHKVMPRRERPTQCCSDEIMCVEGAAMDLEKDECRGRDSERGMRSGRRCWEQEQRKGRSTVECPPSSVTRLDEDCSLMEQFKEQIREDDCNQEGTWKTFSSSQPQGGEQPLCSATSGGPFGPHQNLMDLMLRYKDVGSDIFKLFQHKISRDLDNERGPGAKISDRWNIKGGSAMDMESQLRIQQELIRLAEQSCQFSFDQRGNFVASEGCQVPGEGGLSDVTARAIKDMKDECVDCKTHTGSEAAQQGQQGQQSKRENQDSGEPERTQRINLPFDNTVPDLTENRVGMAGEEKKEPTYLGIEEEAGRRWSITSGRRSSYLAAPGALPGLGRRQSAQIFSMAEQMIPNEGIERDENDEMYVDAEMMTASDPQNQRGGAANNFQAGSSEGRKGNPSSGTTGVPNRKSSDSGRFPQKGGGPYPPNPNMTLEEQNNPNANPTKRKSGDGGAGQDQVNVFSAMTQTRNPFREGKVPPLAGRLHKDRLEKLFAENPFRKYWFHGETPREGRKNGRESGRRRDIMEDIHGLESISPPNDFNYLPSPEAFDDEQKATPFVFSPRASSGTEWWPPKQPAKFLQRINELALRHDNTKSTSPPTPPPPRYVSSSATFTIGPSPRRSQVKMTRNVGCGRSTPELVPPTTFSSSQSTPRWGPPPNEEGDIEEGLRSRFPESRTTPSKRGAFGSPQTIRQKIDEVLQLAELPSEDEKPAGLYEGYQESIKTRTNTTIADNDVLDDESVLEHGGRRGYHRKKPAESYYRKRTVRRKRKAKYLNYDDDDDYHSPDEDNDDDVPDKYLTKSHPRKPRQVGIIINGSSPRGVEGDAGHHQNSTLFLPHVFPQGQPVLVPTSSNSATPFAVLGGPSNQAASPTTIVKVFPQGILNGGTVTGCPPSMQLPIIVSNNVGGARVASKMGGIILPPLNNNSSVANNKVALPCNPFLRQPVVTKAVLQALPPAPPPPLQQPVKFLPFVSQQPPNQHGPIRILRLVHPSQQLLSSTPSLSFNGPAAGSAIQTKLIQMMNPTTTAIQHPILISPQQLIRPSQLTTAVPPPH